MFYLIIFFVFIFGTIIGSFLNVVILRYNTGMKFFGKLFGPKERSVCFSCGKQLEWYELVPVLSFLLLRGKCSVCKSSISWQYPLVEITTGLMFVGIFLKNFSIPASVLYAVIWSLLIVITVYDLRHKIIPDGLVYTFIGLSFLIAVFSGVLTSSLIAAASFFAFFGGLWLVSGGRWLGFGDAKLVVGVGLLLGLARGFTALTFAFWIGAVVSVLLLVVQKVVRWGGLRSRLSTLTMKSEIPFAPFIILGTLISFLCTFDIFTTVGSFLSF